MVSTFPAKSSGWKPTALSRSVLFAPLAFVFVSRKAALHFPRTRAPRVLFTSRIFSILLALFLLETGLLSGAQVRSAKSETDQTAKAAVKAAYEAYLGAWKDKDYAALNKLLSNDYQAVNFQGTVSTKAHEIATAKKDRSYESLSGDVMSVAVFGDSAVASGLIEASWKDDQGSLQRLTLRFLAMLQEQKGDWKLVATQSAKFNQAARVEKE